LTVKTHTIVFATEGGTGNGTKNNPTDIETAINMFPGKNAIIVVDGNNGPVDDFNNPLQLLPGQALLGGDSVVPLHAAHGGGSVNFHVPGARPTLVGDNTAANLIQMYTNSQNEVFGLDLAGDFFDGVKGVNMYRGIVKNMFISGAQGNGIDFAQYNTIDHPSSFIHIKDNLIVDSNFDGVLVRSNLYDNRYHFQTVRIDYNIILHSGEDGIDISNRLTSSGTKLFQSVSIHNVVANYNSQGIQISNLAADFSTIYQRVNI